MENYYNCVLFVCYILSDDDDTEDEYSEEDDARCVQS